MKITHLILVFYLFFSCNNRRNERVANIYRDITPKVKSVCLSNYSEIKLNELDIQNFTTLNCQEFDINGNNIKETNFNPDSTFDYKNCYSYEFDINNNLIKKQTYDKDGSLSDRIMFKYNNKNDEIQNITYTKDDFLRVQNEKSYLYDLNDSIIKYSYKGKMYYGDEQGGDYLYKYDNKGNKTEMLSRDFVGNQKLKYLYKYNENGKIIEEIRYNNKNELDYTSSYKRDDNGNEIERHFKQKPFNEFKNQYKYDKNGNKTESTKLDKNNKLIEKTIYYYDNQNVLLKEIEYNSSNNVIREVEYENKFNEYNDWIEEKTFINRKLTRLLKRDLTYYK